MELQENLTLLEPKYDSCIHFDCTCRSFPSSVSCTSECCSSQLNSPYQPSFVNFRCTKRKQGKQVRSFLKIWFKDHRWLSFCITRNKVFCFYCLYAIRRGTCRSQSAFTSQGFNNWKHAKCKFREHEKRQCHIDACMQYKASQQPSIATQLSLQHAQDQEKHRAYYVRA